MEKLLLELSYIVNMRNARLSVCDSEGSLGTCISGHRAPHCDPKKHFDKILFRRPDPGRPPRDCGHASTKKSERAKPTLCLWDIPMQWRSTTSTHHTLRNRPTSLAPSVTIPLQQCSGTLDISLPVRHGYGPARTDGRTTICKPLAIQHHLPSTYLIQVLGHSSRAKAVLPSSAHALPVLRSDRSQVVPGNKVAVVVAILITWFCLSRSTPPSKSLKVPSRVTKSSLQAPQLASAEQSIHTQATLGSMPLDFTAMTDDEFTQALTSLQDPTHMNATQNMPVDFFNILTSEPTAYQHPSQINGAEYLHLPLHIQQHISDNGRINELSPSPEASVVNTGSRMMMVQ
ncbi:hypothetical protein KCU99_g312, partial [Aureobasidium melanogenum]